MFGCTDALNLGKREADRTAPLITWLPGRSGPLTLYFSSPQAPCPPERWLGREDVYKARDECFNHCLRNVTHRRYTHRIHAANVAAMKKRGKPDIRERFGDAVRTRREELVLTQEDLAEKAHIHRTYLSDIERGSRNLSLINIERLAAALTLSMSELFQRIERS